MEGDWLAIFTETKYAEKHRSRLVWKTSSINPYCPKRTQSLNGSDLPGGLGLDRTGRVPALGQNWAKAHAESGSGPFAAKIAIKRKYLKLLSVFLFNYVWACPFSMVRLGEKKKSMEPLKKFHESHLRKLDHLSWILCSAMLCSEVKAWNL